MLPRRESVTIKREEEEEKQVLDEGKEGQLQSQLVSKEKRELYSNWREKKVPCTGSLVIASCVQKIWQSPRRVGKFSENVAPVQLEASTSKLQCRFQLTLLMQRCRRRLPS